MIGDLSDIPDLKEKSEPIILATCSGICNVGQLITQAVMQLVRRSPG